MRMEAKRFSLKADNNIDLYGEAWLASSPPARAAVVIVHGLGGHSGGFQKIARPLSAAGYDAYLFDQRGHGRSGEQRGHVNDWREYLDDLQRVIDYTKQHATHSGQVFLYGHSMGAMVVLDYLQHCPATPIAGVAISSLPIQSLNESRPYLAWCAAILSRILPRKNIHLGLEELPDHLRDDATPSRLDEDELAHSQVSLKWGAEAFKAIKRIKQNNHHLRVPLLLQHGALDHVNHINGARTYYAGVPHEDKQLIVYPNVYHDTVTDAPDDPALQDLVGWLNAKVNNQTHHNNNNRT